jgi:hypothetical protein
MKEMLNDPGRILFLNGKRWRIIFILLSMDVIIPFYELMGLRLSDKEKFIRFLRNHILNSHKKYLENPNEWASLLTHGFSAISEKFGEQTCLQLLQWGRFTFKENMDDHAHLFQWKAVLLHCHQNPSLWQALRLPSNLSEAIRQTFFQSINMEEYSRVHQQIYEKSLSDWDLCLYALQKFDDEDSAAGNCPSAWVHDTILTHQSRNFWEWALTRLNIEEQTALQRNAAFVAQNQRDLTFAGDLLHPRLLGRSHEPLA